MTLVYQIMMQSLGFTFSSNFPSCHDVNLEKALENCQMIYIS